MNPRIILPIALLAIVAVHSAFAEDDAAKQIKTIGESYTAAYQKIVKAYGAEKDLVKKREIISKQIPALAEEYTDKYQAIADQHAKTPAAVEALVMVCQLSGRTPDGAARVEKSKSLLLAEHLNDKAFSKAVVLWRGDDSTLAKIGKESTSRDVQGVVLYMQMSKAKGREITEKNAAKVKPLMKRIVDEFGDVRMVYPGGLDRGSLAELVDNELFAFENLRIGKVAPEVIGDDIDGVNFKLSDYRGKVVVIDFWGDW